MEQGPEHQESRSFDAIREAFRTGDPERHKMFEEWEQERMRENDGEPASVSRLILAVETLEVHAAAGERDMFLLTYEAAEFALGSDPTVPDDVRETLAERLARAWQEVM